MKIFVLGGDGFCGWPVALSLSANGHETWIVDNFCRRRIDDEIGSNSLTPIKSLPERLAAWREVSGCDISFANIDIAREYGALRNLFRAERPDAIVHLAEQRSVPYSMRSIDHRRLTIEGNLSATHNVLAALVECRLDSHLVHMGSIGVYGYETLGYCIPDGYLRIRTAADMGAREFEILHPPKPLSIYHLSKAQDQLLLAFYSKNDGIRITDLLQGTVWGTQTPETSLDERLINRFDYDPVFGTVLNRFLLQATLNCPPTIYGSGRQTRAFIHLTDAVRCIEIALAEPPLPGERMKILNQISETQRIADLARLISNLTGVAPVSVDNPRDEPPENELDVSNAALTSMGFVPKMLNELLLQEITDVVKRYAYRCDRSQVLPRELATTNV
jgi:UDP-sulfoquinovose synthase